MIGWSDGAVRHFKGLRARFGGLDGLHFLWLEITARCNLTCVHCYASSGPALPLTQRMQFVDWCRVLDDARQLGCRRVQFIGGEPTLHPDLPKLLEHAVRAGYRHCEVFTNAATLRTDLVDTFRRLGIMVHFSFYSHDPATHDRFTGRTGSFERTLAGITLLVERRVRVAAGIIQVTHDARELKQTKKFLKGLGVTAVAHDRVRAVGRGENLLPDGDARNKLCGACWRGKLCVDATGAARPCVFSRDVLVGNVLEDGLAAVITGEPLRTFRRDQFIGGRG
jgi:MoaA/NifB/PqqE/SkfB family radical SAM enzyme